MGAGWYVRPAQMWVERVRNGACVARRSVLRTRLVRGGGWRNSPGRAPFHPFTSRLHRAPKRVQQQQQRLHWVRISGAYIGRYIGDKGRWRDWDWISSPDGQGSAAMQRIRHAGRLRRGGGCVHSIRQEGAALRTVVSSTARTTVHGAAGREAVRIGCRCRTPRFRRARSARQTTRRTPKVCIPSPIPSVSTARCCARSATRVQQPVSGRVQRRAGACGRVPGAA